MDYRPEFLISDKGLGYFSGISLIEQVKQALEEQVKTIMVTGEFDTRETHRVADCFIEKPLRIEDINNALGIEN